MIYKGIESLPQTRIFKSKCRRTYIFQTMNSGGSNNVSLIFERYASSGWWDLDIIKLGFVAKTQFLSIIMNS